MSGPGAPVSREGLDQVGRSAAGELLRHTRAAELRRRLHAAAPLTLLGPGAALAVHLGARVTGVDMGHVAWPWIVVGAAMPLAAALLAGVASSLFHHVDPRRGLRRLDQDLAAADRLQTAHEFLGASSMTPFMAAAIQDAEGTLQRAADHRMVVRPGQEIAARLTRFLIAAGLMTILAVRLTPPELPRSPEDAEAREPEVVAAQPVNPRPDSRSEPVTVRAKDNPVESRPAKTVSDAGKSAPASRQATLNPGQRPKESLGKTGEGRLATVARATPAGDSQGFPSSQQPTAEPPKTAKPPGKPPKPKAPNKPGEQPKKKIKEQSGATAGEGTGMGSGRNPGATDWESKDQVSEDHEDTQDKDADIDEDVDEQEARGGLQPSLRDRRPAVNRDLTIGFGNQKNPDANGRGGPSQEQKKSRGVASLVLGVPIPDHVRGRPLPGKTKITHERVDPRPEVVGEMEASARAPRSLPAGTIARPTLDPWLHALVRDYFTAVREPNREQD